MKVCTSQQGFNISTEMMIQACMHAHVIPCGSHCAWEHVTPTNLFLGCSALLAGPDIADASFKPVAVKSIHYKRLPVSHVVAGQTAALALKKIKRSQVRKGMVLVDEKAHPKATWEFDADIAILTHSTTIQPRYQVRPLNCLHTTLVTTIITGTKVPGERHCSCLHTTLVTMGITQVPC